MIDTPGAATSSFPPVRRRRAAAILRGVKRHSATGPDGVTPMILHRCADSPAVPVALPGRIIINRGEWLDIRKYHN